MGPSQMIQHKGTHKRDPQVDTKVIEQMVKGFII